MRSIILAGLAAAALTASPAFAECVGHVKQQSVQAPAAPTTTTTTTTATTAAPRPNG